MGRVRSHRQGDLRIRRFCCRFLADVDLRIYRSYFFEGKSCLLYTSDAADE